MNRPCISILYLICFFLLVPNRALSEGDPWDSRGVLSSQAPHDIPTELGHFLVYEGIHNFKLSDEQKVYYIVPRVTFFSNDGSTPEVSVSHYSDFSYVTFTLVLVFPSKSDVIRGLRGVNPNISPSNVTQMRYQNLRIEHPLFERYYAVEPGEESDISVSNESFAIGLTSTSYRPDDVNEFVDKLKKGEQAIRVAGCIRFARKTLRESRISWDDIASSRSYMDFRQQSEEKAVLAYQIGKLAANISRDIRIDIYDEFEDGQSTDYLDMVDSISRELYENVKESYVDVATLREWLSPYEIDLNSEIFQPSVLTEFALDVKNTSKSEWKHQFKDQVEEGFRWTDKGSKKAGGNVKLFGIFGGGGGYERQWNRMSERERKRLLENNDYFYNEYDKSFRIHKKGTIIERVDVLIYTDLPVNIDRRVKTSTKATRVIWQERKWIPINVDLKALSTKSLYDQL